MYRHIDSSTYSPTAQSSHHLLGSGQLLLVLKIICLHIVRSNRSFFISKRAHVLLILFFSIFSLPLLGSAEELSVPIDLNRASAEELEQLPGIGPSKASAMIRLRQRLKGYKRVAQILHVKGIGRATLRRIKPMLVVRTPSRVSHGSKSKAHRTQEKKRAK